MKTKKILSAVLSAALIFTAAAGYSPKVEAKTTAWEADVDVSGLDLSKPMVALTFDDGPVGTASDATSQQILDTIEENDAHCTFFYIGQNITDDTRDEIKRAYDLGCEIGNHTWGHMDFTGQTADQMLEAVNSTKELLSDITGLDNFLVRPPYFGTNALAGATINSPLICASVDTTDWSGKSAEDIVDYALDNVQDGSIVLMHETMPNTAVAVKTLIPALIEEGYQLVTVSEMMKAKGVTMTSGRVYLSTAAYWSLVPDDYEESTSPSPSAAVTVSPSESAGPETTVEPVESPEVTVTASVEPSENTDVTVSPSASTETTISPSESPEVTPDPTIEPVDSEEPQKLTGEFKVQSDWNSGYQVEFTVTNNTEVTITDWTAQFTLEDEIDCIWCANQVSKTGDVYMIENAAWNGTLAPGASTTFGFTAVKSGTGIVVPDDICVTTK